ncbi:right-handed parallel beta-helix repeat-containing protein [Haloferax sp. DFSO60]|uniref:right-handed parallel beta-helix repeat-containing protein n=1 Tax=Haloferax sp. DFSO60 TaxID=3388652 RepID=UPI00397C6D45
MSEDHSSESRRLSRREILRKGAAATTVAGLGLTGAAGSATATKKKEDAIPIDGPSRITEPGYYVLTQDIVSTGEFNLLVLDEIELGVGVDDVTIDGQGFTLDGAGKSAVGIRGGSFAFGNNNVTIKNICITGCTQYGIYLASNREATIQNVAVTHCENGIWWDNTLDSTLEGCTLKQNAQGIFTTEGNFRNTFVRNQFIKNGRAAFLVENTDDFLFKNNRIEHNDEGFIISDLGGKSLVTGNHFYRNGFGAGIGGPFSPVDGNEVTIRRNQFVENENEGLEISEAAGFTIEKNSMLRNGTQGIRFAIDVNEMTVSKNLIRGNGDDGILLRNSDRNEIVKNKVLNNGGDGIELRAAGDQEDRGSDNNVIRKNIIKGNAGLPIRIDEFSTGNIIEKNRTDEKNGGAKGGDGDESNSDGNKGDDKDDRNDGNDDTCRVE